MRCKKDVFQGRVRVTDDRDQVMPAGTMRSGKPVLDGSLARIGPTHDSLYCAVASSKFLFQRHRQRPPEFMLVNQCRLRFAVIVSFLAHLR